VARLLRPMEEWVFALMNALQSALESQKALASGLQGSSTVLGNSTVVESRSRTKPCRPGERSKMCTGLLHCLRAAAGDMSHSTMHVNEVDHAYIAVMLEAIVTWQTCGVRNSEGPRIKDDSPTHYRLVSSPSLLRLTDDPIAETHRKVAMTGVVSKLPSPFSSSNDADPGPTMVQRLADWKLVIDTFVENFEQVQSILGESSFLHLMRRFELKESKVRVMLANLRSERTAGRVLKLEVDRKNVSGESGPVLQQMWEQLEAHAQESLSNEEMPRDVPRLAVNKLTVSFKDEIGEGTALIYSCFNDVAHALSKDTSLFVTKEQKESNGTLGVHYNLVPQEDPEQVQRYRQVGRLLGLSLLIDCRFPIIFYRHVYKFLLNRAVSLGDLTFYDKDEALNSARYLHLAQLHKAGAEGGENGNVEDYCFYFDKDDTASGVEVPVDAINFPAYIRWRTAKALTHGIKNELTAMRQGLLDVVPEESLQGLTAEDFQLLLSGRSGLIRMEDLRSHITFEDVRTSGGSEGDVITMEHFEACIWEVLEGFTDMERVQFVSFVIGTPVLDQKMQIKMKDAPATSADGPFARQCLQHILIPSYPDMTAGLLAEVVKGAMEASLEYDTI